MSTPKYDWEAESAARVARMKREQEERAQRYLGEAGGPAPAAPSRFSAPVVAVAICFFVWACAIAAAAWNALFRD